jgi:hypothetical protein
MALQASGPIKYSEIEAEFGRSTVGSTWGLGNYRMDNASEFGGMIVPLDTDCGASSNLDMPTGNNPISFSNFYNARLNIAVDYYTTNENRPVDAVTRFGDPSKRKIVGGFIGYPVDTSESKVALVVNKIISGKSAGVDGASVNECSLRTGSGWIAGTKVTVQVGSSGRVYGAGGDGGGGGNVADNINSSTGPNGLEFNRDGGNGENGTSAVGVQYDNTVVKVRSGGRIVSGFGGGGGGAAAYEDSITERSSAGGGGGGGAGSPAGAGGGAGESTTTTGSAADGSDGSVGSVPNSGEQSGAGGAGGDPVPSASDNEAQGGAGGRGRDEETTGTGYDNDGTGQIGLGRRTSGNPPVTNNEYAAGNPGNAGGDGAAIRRTGGLTVTITNDGTIRGETTVTGVS